MKLLLVAGCLTLAVLPMCKPDPAKTTAGGTADPASPAEARAQFDILRDTADLRWQRMLRSDDQKLADLRGLVRDLERLPGHDRRQLATLRQATEQLPRQRYDRRTMAESDLITRYDNAQDSVLHVLLPLAAPDGNAPTAAVRDYVERVNLADANVLGYRVAYDRAAKAYNAYLQLHAAELARLGGRYGQLRPLPLFELQATAP